MKKILSIYFTILMAAVLLSQNIIPLCSAEVYANEVSDVEIPTGYTPIYTISDLAGINSNPSGKYILMNDIDMTEETSQGGSWSTGHGWTPLNTFSGILDGNGHRIIGMHIYGEFKGYSHCSGLFSELKGNVRNLGITDCEINVEVLIIGGFSYTGGISGSNSGVIENCYVNGAIIANYPSNSSTTKYTGGITAFNEGIITNCYNAANISVSGKNLYDDYTCGIAATDQWNNSNNNNIKNCYNIGKISNPSYRGFMGAITLSGRLVDCAYYLNTSVKNPTNKIGKPLTDAQMKSEALFTGFDFNNVWMIDELSPYPYPQLKSCPQVRVDKLELKSLPNKLTYSQGDKLDLTGAVLSITYENGVVTSTEVEENMVSGIDINDIGTQTAIIQYLNGTCSFDITVNEVKATDITLSKTEYSIDRNDKLQLKAVISPDNTSNKSIKWETDNDIVATVTQDGTVRAINGGTATITATTENGLKASCIVTVKIPASSIKLNIKKLILKKGKKKLLKATVKPLETTDIVKWTSSNPKVATVTEDGVVKAKKLGYTTIMAKTTSGKYASVKVTVKK